MKLLCGLYHPTKGKILLDGVDVSTLSPEDYFQEFSVVFQEVFAFAFPLSSNVACTPNDQIDEARLRESLRLAGLAEKVESLPKGAETSLLRTLDKEGVELSGGQMQRLMLARALYKNASMLLLDEPTAALDPLGRAGHVPALQPVRPGQDLRLHLPPAQLYPLLRPGNIPGERPHYRKRHP